MVHLYLHIPFCHEICPYCSFYKHKPGNTSQKDFIDALIKELRWNAQRYDLATVTTLYLGGGTPSLLSEKNLTLLFSELHEHLQFSQLKEVTLEANPSTFQEKKAHLFKELGITRVSLGVQSFDPDQLKVLGRDHTREEGIASYHMLREAEMPAINIDLMFSTPGQTATSWQETLETTIGLCPDHISAYNLTYEEDTEYFQKFLTGEYTDEEEKNASFFTLADALLEEAGYEHYETSNYAREGQRSLHNQGYWRGNPYLGVGPSAVSCIDRTRRKNLSDTAGYLKRVNAIGHAMEEHETLDEEAWRLERLALELRTLEGVSMEYLPSPELLLPLLEQNLVKKKGDFLTTTKKGACLVDGIVEYLA